MCRAVWLWPQPAALPLANGILPPPTLKMAAATLATSVSRLLRLPCVRTGSGRKCVRHCWPRLASWSRRWKTFVSSNRINVVSFLLRLPEPVGAERGRLPLALALSPSHCLLPTLSQCACKTEKACKTTQRALLDQEKHGIHMGCSSDRHTLTHTHTQHAQLVASHQAMAPMPKPKPTPTSGNGNN